MSIEPQRVAVLLPGIAAVGLTLLYGTGALIKSGQLRGASLSVRDTLPLAPLEQMLALGIGTFVTSLGWVLAFVLFLAVFAGPIRARPHEPPPFSISPRVRKALLAAVILLFAWGVLFAFYSEPFFVAIVLVAQLAFFGAVAIVERRGRRPVVYLVLGFFAAILVVQTASAYVYPSPLPSVELRLKNNAQTVSGTLVATTGSTWFISTHERTFRAIPTERVAVSIVRSRSRTSEPRPVLKVAWEWVSKLWND